MEIIETYIILLVYATKVIDTNCPPNDNLELLRFLLCNHLRKFDPSK